MKGIYTTQEGKQEIEDKIAEIEKERFYGSESNSDYRIGQQKVWKEILALATILPVEASWEKLEENLLEGLHEHTKLEDVISIDYPNGVIIEPKK